MTTRNEARGDALAVAALLVALAAYFWPWITLGSVFYQVDIAFMDHPLRVHAFQVLRAGHFPFWSDAILCGFPVFGEGQAALLYPLSWLYFFLAPSAALNAFVVVHYVVLGLGCYALMRAQPLAPAAALFGTLTLVFSSFMIVEHVLLGFLSVAAWTPLLLWLELRYLRRGHPGHLALAGLVVAMQQLAGAPLETLLSLTLAGSFGLAAPGVDGPPSWRRRLAAATVPALLGSLLAAPQLLATLEFLGESTRAAGTVVARNRLLPGAALLTLVFPRFLGIPANGFVGPPIPGWEETLFLFLGWSPVVLAVLGYKCRGPVRFWSIASLVALALSLEVLYPVSSLLRSVPPLSLFRWPARVLFWYACGTSMLAAFGYQRVCGPGEPLAAAVSRRRLRVLAALGAAATLAFMAFRGGLFAVPVTPARFARVIATRDQDFFAFAGCGLVLLALAAARGWRLQRQALAGAAFAVLVVGWVLNVRPGGVPPDVYETEPPSVAVARAAQGEHGRIFAAAPWGLSIGPIGAEPMRSRVARLPANVHLLFGLRAAGQFDVEATATLRRNRAFLATPGPRLLELVGVNAVAPRPGVEWSDTVGWSVLTPGDRNARVAVRRAPLSRAFLADDYVVVEEQAARERMIRDPSSRLRERVVLERAPAWPPGAPEAAGIVAGRVEFARDEPGSVELRVETPRNALLVLADSWYPGWQASVDGRAVETYVADGFVRAVAVPAGRHAVAFEYRSPSLRAGLALALAGLLATLAVLSGFGPVNARRAPPEHRALA